MKIDYSNEIWCDVPGYEGMYQGSNLGRVKSLARKVWNGKTWYVVPERILKQRKNVKDGYYEVLLCKDSKYKTYRVHRLIYETFCCKLVKETEVHHINHISSDNRIDNLLAVDVKEHKMFHIDKNVEIMHNANLKRQIGVIALYRCNNEYVAEYPSIAQASRDLNVDKTSIARCLKGKQGYVGDYIFKYAS